MSDDTPTQRFDQPVQSGGTPAVSESRSPSPLIYVLIALAVLLIIAIVAVVVLLTNRGSGVPVVALSPTSSTTSSATPSATPTAGATPTTAASATPSSTPAQPTGPHFTKFIAPKNEGACSLGGPAVPAFVPRVKVSWASAGAVSAWFVNGTSDAATSGFMEIPLSGNQSKFSSPQDFHCHLAVDVYTITLVGPQGQHVSKTWHVRNVGDVTP